MMTSFLSAGHDVDMRKDEQAIVLGLRKSH